MSYSEAIGYVISSIQNKHIPEIILSTFQDHIVNDKFFDDINKLTQNYSHILDPRLKGYEELLLAHTFPPDASEYIRPYMCIYKIALNLVHQRYQPFNIPPRIIPIDLPYIGKYDFYFEGRVVCTIKDETQDKDIPTTIALLPNNTLITHANGPMIVWNLNTYEEEATISNDDCTYYILPLHDNKILVGNCNDPTFIWDLTSQKKHTDLEYMGVPNTVDIFPDGRIACLGDTKYGFEIYDCKKEFVFDRNVDRDYASAIKILKNNKVAIGKYSVYIWDLETHKLDFSIHILDKNISTPIMKLEELPDKRLLIIAAKSVHVLNLITREVDFTYESTYISISLLVDEKLVLCSEGTITLIDLCDKSITSYKCPIGTIDYIKRLPNNDILLVSVYGLICVWDFKQFRYNFDTYEGITGVEILPDGRVVLTLEEGLITILR